MVRKLLNEAAMRLTNSDTPLLDARVLLARAAGCDNAAFLFEMPDEKALSLFNEYIEKRASGVPVAYILGEKEFMGLSFSLNSHTLIPRPDTECLVEKVLAFNKKEDAKILDLCTGSGCIGISLAKMIEKSNVFLTDISEEALSMAFLNAEKNGISSRAKVFSLDILSEPIKEKYDIITANPPYIESSVLETLAVKDFEPSLALDGGEDGLTFYRTIAQKAFCALNEDGILALEIGFNQKESVCALLKEFSFVHTFKDYGGNDRVIIAEK